MPRIETVLKLCQLAMQVLYRDAVEASYQTALEKREAGLPVFVWTRLGEKLDALEVGFGGFEFGEEALFGLELAGVDAAAAGFDADGVLEVEHLVVEEVLDGAARGVGAVEDAADDDGVVGGVVVAEHPAGVVGGPG
jgi:hypothetical protein